jgi:hypothetical protein
MIKGRAVSTSQKRAIIERLFAIWEAHPSQRLGQLLANYAGQDIFYDEDYALLEKMESKAFDSYVAQEEFSQARAIELIKEHGEFTFVGKTLPKVSEWGDSIVDPKMYLLRTGAYYQLANKIAMIKMFRSAFDMSLRDAKDLVEQLVREYPAEASLKLRQE